MTEPQPGTVASGDGSAGQPPTDSGVDWPRRPKPVARAVIFGGGGVIVALSLAALATGRLWWPWLAGLGVAVTATAVVRRRAFLAWISAVVAALVVAWLGSTPENDWRLTLLLASVFAVWCVATDALRRHAPVPPHRPRIRRAGSLLLFAAGACLLVGGAIAATMTVHPDGASFIPTGATCGSAVLGPEIRLGGPGQAGTAGAAITAMATADCAPPRHEHQAVALTFAGWGALSLVLSLALSRSAVPDRNRPPGWPWTAPRLTAATVVAVTVLAGSALVAATPHTLDLSDHGDASQLTTGVCQAMLAWSASINPAVTTYRASVTATDTVAAHRQAVITLITAVDHNFRAMLTTLQTLNRNEPDAGYQAFLETLIGPLTSTAAGLDNLVDQAVAMTNQDLDTFNSQKKAISTKLAGSATNLTIDPTSLSGLPATTALALTGALYSTPACQPILNSSSPSPT